MFGHSGILYVYLNYGIFNLTNIICGPRGRAGAVLIRSAEILEGQNIALDNLERNKFVKANDFLATGPGKLSVALNIMTKQNGLDITTSKEIFIDLAKSVVPPSDIIKTKRVGVEYAGKSKHLPWRFYIKNNNFVSYR
jgi:DNA-3-methyladenine glycosylase